MKQSFAVINLFISLIILISSCGRGESGNKEIPTKPVAKAPIIKPGGQNRKIDKAHLKLYVENTASMDGYFEGYTQFKEVLSLLVNEVETIDTPKFLWDFYLINNVIIKQNISNRITSELTKNWVHGKGQRGNSEFEREVERILIKHKKDDISVLAADFIYSPKEGQTQKRLMEFQEFTKKAFLDANIDKKDLEVLLLRFNSDFNDIYYDINDKEVSDLNSRPYFLMIIAQKDLMNIFNEYITPNLKSRPGYTNSLIFNRRTSNDYSADDYTILTSTLNSTLLKAHKIKGKKVKSVEVSKSDQLQFAIAMNLSQLPVSEEYILNKSNYDVKNYSIIQIGKINNGNIHYPESNTFTKIMGSDKNKLKGLTHALLLSSNSNDVNNVDIKIKKQLPDWVKHYSNSDDRDIATNKAKQSQTFGLEFFLVGIREAYQHNNDNLYYTSIIVPVIPSPKSSGLWTVLFIGLLLMIIVGIIMIIKNKKQRQ